MLSKSCGSVLKASTSLPTVAVRPCHAQKLVSLRCTAGSRSPLHTYAKTTRPVTRLNGPVHVSISSRRAISTGSVPSSRPQASGVRVGTLFLALSILGLGATSIGLYNYYNSLKTFPAELRKELRAALRCKARHDYVFANKNFATAWEKATTTFADQLGLLKITGIGIAWSEMLEEAGRRADQGGLSDSAVQAYDVLQETYNWARQHVDDTRATEEQRMRVVSMAVKLAELADGQPGLDTQTEQQLTWAVEEVLRLASSGTSTKKTPGEAGILVGEMDLPSWVTKTDIGATLESLGNLYARKGNVEYAMPLYLQSISLLMPPPSARKEEPSTEEKCHAATIMNNLSSLIASAPNAPSQDIKSTTQAFAWAMKASQIAGTAIAGASEVDLQVGACKPVQTVALYNLGMLKLMDGDKVEAKKFLDQAKAKGKEWGLKDAEFRANEVLKSL